MVNYRDGARINLKLSLGVWKLGGSMVARGMLVKFGANLSFVADAYGSGRRDKYVARVW